MTALGGSERAEEGGRISPLEGNGQALLLLLLLLLHVFRSRV